MDTFSKHRESMERIQTTKGYSWQKIKEYAMVVYDIELNDNDLECFLNPPFKLFITSDIYFTKD